MKRFGVLLPILLLAVLLSGCGEQGVSASASAAALPVPPDASTEQTTPADEHITYAAQISADKDETKTAADGTVLAVGHFEIPELRAFRADGAQIEQANTPGEKRALETAAVFRSAFTQWLDGTDFQEIADWAEEDYAQSGTPDGKPWEKDSSYDAELTTSVWQTDHRVSVRSNYYTYTGGAHPNTVQMAWNFDLDAGVYIDPAVIADDEQGFRNAVSAEIVRQADARAAADGMEPAGMFWENYRDIAAQWTSYAVSFDADGMTVIFSPYEMACYAAGPQKFALNMDFLEPYLGDYGRTLLGVNEAE